jgi:hypothetical protein
MKSFEMKIFFGIMAAVMSLAVFSFVVKASFNEQINYQGKITDSGGIAIADGQYCMKFVIHTASTGDASIWSEEWKAGTSKVELTSGLFSVMLGTHQNFDNVNFDQTPLYLEVLLDSACDDVYEEEFYPRKIMGSVPAAFESKKLAGFSWDAPASIGSATPDAGAFTALSASDIFTTSDGSILSSSSGILTLGGTGGTYNEDLTLNFDGASDTVIFGSTTAVGSLDFSAFNLATTGNILGANITATGTAILGDTTSDIHGMNTAAVASQMLTASYANSIQDATSYFIKGTQTSSGNVVNGRTVYGYYLDQNISGTDTNNEEETESYGMYMNIRDTSIINSAGAYHDIYGFISNVQFLGTNTNNESMRVYGSNFYGGGNMGTTGATAHFGIRSTASGTADTNYAIHLNSSGATANYSIYVGAGTVYLGGDNIKTYWGTGLDDSMTHNGTNFIARSEVGSHDFIFDQYSDIITGNANIDAGTGTVTASGFASTTGDLDLNGNYLIIDADADTKLRAYSDDIISFDIGGGATGEYLFSATDLNMASNNLITTGAIYNQADNAKHYFGAFDDDSIAHNGTNLVFRSEVGSHDFIFDQYSDIEAGAANFTTTGTFGAGAITGTSLSAGSGAISTTGLGTFGTVNFGSSTGVSGTATNGVLTFLGLGDGVDENLLFDFNTTTNQIGLSSGTGVGTMDFSAFNLATTGTGIFGQIIDNGLSALSLVMTDADKQFISAVAGVDYETPVNKDIPNGYPGLDANGDLVGVFIPRYDTDANMGLIVLEDGEIGTTSDTHKLLQGDGLTAGGLDVVNYYLNNNNPSISSSGSARFDGGLGVGAAPNSSQAFIANYDNAVNNSTSYFIKGTQTSSGNTTSGKNTYGYYLNQDISGADTDGNSKSYGLYLDIDDTSTMNGVSLFKYTYGVYSDTSFSGTNNLSMLFYNYAGMFNSGGNMSGMMGPSYHYGLYSNASGTANANFGIYLSSSGATVNYSIYVGAGTVYLGADNIKTYWGTSLDDSMTHNGTNFVARSEVGSHDFIFDQYSDIITGNANIDAGTGTVTASGFASTTGDLDLNGNYLIIDADADTKLRAYSDDIISLDIGGGATGEYLFSATDLNMASNNLITTGAIYSKADNAKHYFGASDDDSIAHNGTNLVFRSEVGSHDFIFDQYSDIEAGVANFTTTGAGTIGTVKFGSSTGVSATAASGVLTLAGLSGGIDENLLFDFERDTNSIVLSSGTSVGTMDFSAFNLATTGTLGAGATTLSSLIVDTTTLVVNASGYEDKVGIGTLTPDALLHIAAPAATAGTEKTDLILGNKDFTADMITSLLFQAGTDGGSERSTAAIKAKQLSGTTGELQFYTDASGLTQKWTISTAGSLLSGTNGTSAYNILTAGTLGAGAITGTSLKATGLTSGRVPYITTAGLLTDSANMTYNGTTFNLGISGTGNDENIYGTLGTEKCPALEAANWTYNGAQVTVGGGTIQKTADGTAVITPNSLTLSSGQLYKITITYSAMPQNYCIPAVDNTNLKSGTSATTYTDYFIANSSTPYFRLIPSNTSRFTISSISIKQVTNGSLVAEGNSSYIRGNLRVANVMAVPTRYETTGPKAKIWADINGAYALMPVTTTPEDTAGVFGVAADGGTGTSKLYGLAGIGYMGTAAAGDRVYGLFFRSSCSTRADVIVGARIEVGWTATTSTLLELGTTSNVTYYKVDGLGSSYHLTNTTYAYFGAGNDVKIGYTGTYWDFNIAQATSAIRFNQSQLDTDFIVYGDTGAMMTLDAGDLSATFGGNTNLSAGTTKLAYTTGAPTLGNNGEISIAYVNPDNRIYFYSNGGQHYVTATAGFEIPNFETEDPLSQEEMKVGDIVMGQINYTVSDGALHGVWVKWDSVKKDLLDEIKTKITLDDLSKNQFAIEDSSFLAFIKSALEKLGIVVSNGIAQLKEIAVDKIIAKKAKIEKIEMVDSATGETYCTWIENGEWKKAKGECDGISSVPIPDEPPVIIPLVPESNPDSDNLPNQPQPEPEPNPNPDPQPNPEPNPETTPETPSDSGETSMSADSPADSESSTPSGDGEAASAPSSDSGSAPPASAPSGDAGAASTGTFSGGDSGGGAAPAASGDGGGSGASASAPAAGGE